VIKEYVEEEKPSLQLETDFTFNFDQLLYDLFDVLNEELSEETLDAL